VNAGRKQSEIDQDYKQAAELAALAAPYRHPRLSAMRLPASRARGGHPRDDLGDVRAPRTTRLTRPAASGRRPALPWLPRLRPGLGFFSDALMEEVAASAPSVKCSLH
jgi:hypothetical protein